MNPINEFTTNKLCKVEELVCTPDEGVFYSSLISFSPHKPITNYIVDGKYTEAGKKLCKSMIKNKHKSVFFQSSIEIEGFVEAYFPKFVEYKNIRSNVLHLPNEYSKTDCNAKMSLYCALVLYNYFKLDFQYHKFTEILEKAFELQDAKEVFQCWKEVMEESDYKLDIKDEDRKLIEKACFHTITFKMEMPIFVKNQLIRHSQDISFNEISGRYVDFGKQNLPIYCPDNWREQSKDKKQGSVEGSSVNFSKFLQALKYIRKLYEKALGMGVCYEQARSVLPLAQQTALVITGNLWALSRMLSLRLETDTQLETRKVAESIKDIIEKSQIFKDNFTLEELKRMMELNKNYYF